MQDIKEKGDAETKDSIRRQYNRTAEGGAAKGVVSQTEGGPKSTPTRDALVRDGCGAARHPALSTTLATPAIN